MAQSGQDGPLAGMAPLTGDFRDDRTLMQIMHEKVVPSPVPVLNFYSLNRPSVNFSHLNRLMDNIEVPSRLVTIAIDTTEYTRNIVLLISVLWKLCSKALGPCHEALLRVAAQYTANAMQLEGKREEVKALGLSEDAQEYADLNILEEVNDTRAREYHLRYELLLELVEWTHTTWKVCDKLLKFQESQFPAVQIVPILAWHLPALDSAWAQMRRSYSHVAMQTIRVDRMASKTGSIAISLPGVWTKELQDIRFEIAWDTVYDIRRRMNISVYLDNENEGQEGEKSADGGKMRSSPECSEEKSVDYVEVDDVILSDGKNDERCVMEDGKGDEKNI